MAKKQDKTISRTEPAAVTGGNAAPAGTTTAASEQEVPLPHTETIETTLESVPEQKPVVEPLRVPVRNIFGQPVIQHTGGIGHGNAR